jgi:TRAP-type C4-dicarboxylate transport system substrate-binding protein
MSEVKTSIFKGGIMCRKTLSLALVALGLCFCLTLSFISVSQAASKKITLQAITAWPKTTFMVQNFMRFLARVNEKAAQMYPGQFEINYKGGPEVISFREQVEAARTGLVDMVFTATSYYTSIIPVGDGFSASVLKPWDERDKGVFAFMQKIHADKANVYFLSRMGSGIPFQIYSNKPVNAVADLKGMKIRGSPTLIPFLKKVGANPVMMAPGDIYTGLERGVVDGFVWPAAQISEWGWEKVTKYVIEPALPYGAIDVVLVNLDTWKKLPTQFQDLLIYSAKEDEFRTIVRALEYIPRENARLKKMGIQFLELPDAEAKKMEEIANDALWDAVISRDPVNGPKFREMISSK